MLAIHDDLHIHPGLVVAHPNRDFVASLSRAFGQLGWHVHTTQTGPEARRLACDARAELVVLDADLPGESGWLTCSKLIEDQPGTRVLLISDGPEKMDPEFARYVGAAGLFPLSEGVDQLLKLAREIVPALSG